MPVLAGVDAASTYCYLLADAELQRDNQYENLASIRMRMSGAIL